MKVKSVSFPLAEIFCTTISTFIEFSDRGLKIDAAIPGLSFTPIKVIFGIENFNIAPAGIDKCDSGHHHLIIDAKLPDPNLPIPSSNNYIHFGAGQTETELVLEPGKHSLRLLMGNFAHLPQFSSEEIKIEVIETK